MTRSLTPETLVYGFASAGDPRVSPDGARIVYTLNSMDPETRRGRSQLWLRGIDAGAPRPLSPDGERAGGARWSPDGTRIAFTVACGRGSTIVALTLDPPEGREVTHHEEGIGDLAWSPDGGRIAYTTLFDPENPDELEPEAGAPPKVRVTRRFDYKQDGRGWVGDVRNQVFVVDVERGDRRRITTVLVDHSEPAWSPDGQWLAVHVSRPVGPGSQLMLFGVDSGEVRAVGPDRCMIDHWAWSPGGDRIVYTGDLAPPTFQSDFFIYDVASGETRRLTDDLASLPADQPVWLDERRLLFHAMRAGGSQLEIIDTVSGELEPVTRWEAR
ncbi:MAG: PD40 domain-containing protein, partial [Chloroflexia bacterium]|nr:PD40 domain-containing protein [Chloroflexia bacterium]